MAEKCVFLYMIFRVIYYINQIVTRCGLIGRNN